MNEKSFHIYDPAQPGKLGAYKGYSTNQGFSCLTTTTDGFLALASDKGEVKLFKQVGQNAKTVFPGFGEPIKCIDSTANGDYLLATSDTYILLIPTRNGGIDGFLKPLGKNKPKPIKLTLHPKDIVMY